MAHTVQELSRVIKKNGRAVFIVGHESRVLGVPFYNADMLERIARESGLFDVVLRQQRLFLNRFGQKIREDILNLQRAPHARCETTVLTLGRAVAHGALESSLAIVAEKNSALLQEAIDRVNLTDGTPFFDSSRYSHYQTRESVMMVKENGDR
jgi:hypothetical protein